MYNKYINNNIYIYIYIYNILLYHRGEVIAHKKELIRAESSIIGETKPGFDEVR